jgi:hypothetical protein
MLDRGKIAVLSMFALAIGAAAFGWWWNFRRGERCLAFYGGQAATLIRTAPTVEILEVETTDVRVTKRIDISKAPGLLNARAALLDDASFEWNAAPPASFNPSPRLLRFSNAGDEVLLRFDTEERWLEVLPDGKGAKLDPKTASGWKQFLERYP